ncbi:prolipoprotein diacylglyceryl transferase [soil metagenome]
MIAALQTLLPSSIPSPDPVLQQFQLGPITVHTYALCLMAGMVAAAIITSRRMDARGAPKNVTIDIVIWAIPLGIIGARFYHVFTHVGDYFYPGADIAKILFIWEGGNALYGALIGGTVGAIIGCRRAGIRLWSFADALAPGMLVAQMLGRFGNYFNHELYGLPTTLPWGLEIESSNTAYPPGLPEGTLFHPLFLYEIIWNLIGLALILFISRRFHLQWGKVFALYLIWYGLGRSWLEAIRIDPTSDGLFGIPANIWASFVAIAIGLALFLVQSRRHPEPEPSVYLPGREPVATVAGSDDAGGDEPADDTDADSGDTDRTLAATK